MILPGVGFFNTASMMNLERLASSDRHWFVCNRPDHMANVRALIVERVVVKRKPDTWGNGVLDKSNVIQGSDKLEAGENSEEHIISISDVSDSNDSDSVAKFGSNDEDNDKPTLFDSDILGTLVKSPLSTDYAISQLPLNLSCSTLNETNALSNSTLYKSMTNETVECASIFDKVNNSSYTRQNRKSMLNYSQKSIFSMDYKSTLGDESQNKDSDTSESRQNDNTSRGLWKPRTFPGDVTDNESSFISGENVDENSLTEVSDQKT